MAPHVPIGTDGRICNGLGEILPGLRRALAHDQRGALLRDYDMKMGGWSYLAYNRAHDVTFANDLGNADAAVAVAGGSTSGTIAAARKAAQDVRKAARYCQDNVTDAPGANGRRTP